MSEKPSVRVRFAPSPTGSLHVGNVRTAFYNWLFARQRGGAFILRIEDTDIERNEAGSESRILEDLRWLGLDWDEGPGAGGDLGPYRQSERQASYKNSGERLLATRDAYRCFCSQESLEAEREAQRAQGLPPRYTGRCRAITPEVSASRAAKGEPFVLRLHVRADSVAFDDAVRGRVEFPGSQIGDPVLVRSDGRPAYNFAVVVDDIEMKITHVVRGEDHLSNTPRQILLYRALGGDPPVFAHLSMILGPDGGRLHKRHGSVSVAQFREAGVAPEALLNYLALLGWSHPEGKEILSVEEMKAAFGFERVSGSAATFDPGKLAFLNAHHLRTMDPGRLFELAAPFLREVGLLHANPEGEAAAWWSKALTAVSGQMETLKEAGHAIGWLFDPSEEPEALAASSSEEAVLEAFAREASSRQMSAAGAFREAAKAAGIAAGVKGRELFHPLRIAFTGREKGPELDRVAPLIDEGSRLNLPRPVPDCAARARGRLERARARKGM